MIEAIAQSSTNGCGGVLGASEDTQILIYESNDGSCNSLSFFDCNEDGPSAAGTNYPAGDSFNLTAGTTYYLIVDEYYFNGLETGTFCIEVTFEDTCPSNSGCTNVCASNYDPSAVVDDGSCIYPSCDDGCALTIDSYDNVNCQCVNTTPNPDDGCDLTTDVFDLTACAIFNNPPNVNDGCALTTDSFDAVNCQIVNTPPSCDDGCALTVDSFDAANCQCVNTAPNPDDGCALTTDSYDPSSCSIINAPPNPDDGCALTSDSFDAVNCQIVNTPPSCDDGCALTVDSFDAANCQCVNTAPNPDDGCALTTDAFDAVNCQIVNTPPSVDDACALTVDSFDAVNCQVVNTPPNCADACPLTTDSFNFATCTCENTPPSVDDGCDLTNDSFNFVACQILNIPPNPDDGCALTSDSFDAANCLIVNTPPNVDDGCALTSDSFDAANCLIVNTPPNPDDGCFLTTDSFDAINCQIINTPPNVDDACALTSDSFDAANCVIVNTPPSCDDGDPTTTDSFNAVDCQCVNTTIPVFGCTDPCATNYDASANTDDGNCTYPTCDDACPLTIDSYDAINCQCINMAPNPDDGCPLTLDFFEPATCEIINEPPLVDDACALTADSFDAVNCVVVNTPPNVDDGCALTTDSFDASTCQIVNTPPSCDDGNPNTSDSFDVVNCQCLNVDNCSYGCIDPTACNYDSSATCDDGNCEYTSCAPGAISSTIYVDANGNGIQDAGEPPLVGATVVIVGAGPDGIMGTADDINYGMFTDAAGNFTQGGLEPGTYNIYIALPSGFNFVNGTSTDEFNTNVLANNTSYIGVGGFIPVLEVAAGCQLAIPLAQGWDMISSYCIPVNDSMEVIFEDIASNTIQVKNLVDFYIPQLNVNTFESGGHRGWKIEEGYQVKSVNAATLVMEGSEEVDVNADQVPLDAGWNIIAYWLQGNAMPVDVLNLIANDVIQIKDLGAFYIPAITTGNLVMSETRGYQIKMSNVNTLQYDPAHAFRPAPEDVVEEVSPSHFVRNGMPHPNNAIVVVMEPEAGIVNYGDEVGVFNPEGLLVGSSVYQGGHIGVMIYGDDMTEEGIDGMAAGESLVLKVWDKLAQEERVLDVTFTEGPAYYEKDALSIGELKSVNTGIGELDVNTSVHAVPNPATSEVVFNIELDSRKEDVSIQIYNLEGKLLSELRQDKALNAGKYQMKYDVSNLPNGVYMYQLIGDGKIMAIERLTVAR